MLAASGSAHQHANTSGEEVKRGRLWHDRCVKYLHFVKPAMGDLGSQYVGLTDGVIEPIANCICGNRIERECLRTRAQSVLGIV